MLLNRSRTIVSAFERLPTRWWAGSSRKYRLGRRVKRLIFLVIYTPRTQKNGLLSFSFWGTDKLEYAILKDKKQKEKCTKEIRGRTDGCKLLSGWLLRYFLGFYLPHKYAFFLFLRWRPWFWFISTYVTACRSKFHESIKKRSFCTFLHHEEGKKENYLPMGLIKKNTTSKLSTFLLVFSSIQKKWEIQLILFDAKIRSVKKMFGEISLILNFHVLFFFFFEKSPQN